MTFQLLFYLAVCMSHMLLTNGRTLSDSSHFSGAGNRGHKELLLDSTISDEEHLAIPHNKQFPEVATPKTKAEKDIVKLASNITLKPHHILLKHIYSTASRLQNYKVEENKNIPVSETLEGTLNNNNVNVFLLDLNVDRSPDMLYDINVKPKITEPSEDSDLLESALPLLSDGLCKMCKEKGDEECIKRHCLKDGPV